MGDAPPIREVSSETAVAAVSTVRGLGCSSRTAVSSSGVSPSRVWSVRSAGESSVASDGDVPAAWSWPPDSSCAARRSRRASSRGITEGSSRNGVSAADVVVGTPRDESCRVSADSCGPLRTITAMSR